MTNYVALETNLKLLQFTMLWPTEGLDMNDKRYLKNFIFIIGVPIFYSVTSIITFIHGIKGLNNLSIDDLIENLTLITITLTYYYMIFCYLLKREKMKELFKAINDFSKFKKPDNFNYVNERCRRITIFLPILTIVICTFYTSYSLIFKKKCLELKAANNLDVICGMVTQIWTPFDITKTPLNQIIFLLEAFTVTFIFIEGVSIFSFCFVCIENIIARFHVLKNILVKTFQIEDCATKKNMLRIFISHHLIIIDLVDLLNECYRIPLFCTITVFSLDMALIVFLFSISMTLKTLVHLCGWILVWFMLCKYGQNLLDESESLVELLYDIPWYAQEDCIQRDILFILRRAQLKLPLWAGVFRILCYTTFQEVITNTYTVVNLLNIGMNS